MTLRTLLLWIFMLSATPASAVYKCETSNHVTYSDVPCPNSKILDINNVPDADIELARKRALEEKRNLMMIEKEHQKIKAKEKKDHERNARAAALHQKKCAALYRRKTWAEEDAATATKKSREKAKRKAQRLAKTFEGECNHHMMQAG